MNISTRQMQDYIQLREAATTEHSWGDAARYFKIDKPEWDNVRELYDQVRLQQEPAPTAEAVIDPPVVAVAEPEATTVASEPSLPSLTEVETEPDEVKQYAIKRDVH